MPDYDCTAKCLVCVAEAFFFLSSFLFCAFPEIQKFQKGANASKKRSETSFCSHASRRSALSPLTVHRRAFHFPTLLLRSMQLSAGLKHNEAPESSAVGAANGRLATNSRKSAASGADRSSRVQSEDGGGAFRTPGSE